MIKKSIALYNQDRSPQSLGELSLNRGYYVEDIFYAIEDAKNFDDLDKFLRTIISDKLIIDTTSSYFILYKVYNSTGTMNYLKIKVKDE